MTHPTVPFHPWVRLTLSLMFLVGFGPFVCNDGTVEDARRALKKGEAEKALGLLRGVDSPSSKGETPASQAALLNEKIPGYRECLAELATAQAGTNQSMMTRCCQQVGGQILTTGPQGCTADTPCCLKPKQTTTEVPNTPDATSDSVPEERSLEPDGSLLKIEAPEVQLLVGQIQLLLANPKAARDALDQAYRLVAELDVKQEKSDTDATDQTQVERQARINDLRARIAFSLGLVAADEQKWEDAQVEFLRVLALIRVTKMPAGTWLAWHQANPPCHKRDDDHEPDNARSEAKPYDPEKGKDRVLCPNNEDWYTVEGKKDSMLFVSVDGTLDTEDDEVRNLTLTLFYRDEPRPIRSRPFKDGRSTVGITRIGEDTPFQFSISGPGTAEFKYNVRVEVVPPCPYDDKEEDNDSADAAKEVEDGQKGGLKACPDDEDWYRVKVPARKHARFRSSSIRRGAAIRRSL